MRIQDQMGYLQKPDPLQQLGNIVICTPKQLAAEIQDLWNQAYLNKYYYSGMQDINASTETAYPNDSLNKKLEAAKKWLKERK